MSIKEDMNAARSLIKAKRYEEARAILRNVDHIKAVEWLDKLDKIAPEKVKAQPVKHKPKATPQQMGIGCAVLLVPLIACCAWLSMPSPEIRAMNRVQDVLGVIRVISLNSNESTQEITAMICIQDVHLTNVTARAIDSAAKSGYGRNQFDMLLVMGSDQRVGTWFNGEIVGNIDQDGSVCQ